MEETLSGGTLSASAFGIALRQNTLGIPEDSILPGAEHLGPMPHVFLADEAFPLRRNIMRPYPGYNTGEKKVFNTRLSHVRRMVECVFGILSSQWRVYRRVLCVSPEVAENVVKATCMLHNFMRWDTSTDLLYLLKHPQLSHHEVSRTHLALAPTMPAEMLWQ
ncbi:hypothetical protein ACEWY4_027338 [Coilia grayii]|uniref:DDE Tnp4 domain-containing protein n=1 Tax=Coilia grayii TaxID=363190 RepID=A0ABD1IS43_9TELE